MAAELLRAGVEPGDVVMVALNDDHVQVAAFLAVVVTGRLWPGVVAAWLVLAAVGAALVPLIGWAFTLFDVGRLRVMRGVSREVAQMADYAPIRGLHG